MTVKTIELEESFTENDRYLVDEHLKHGTDDFLVAGVGDATFVVPYKYRKAGLSNTDSIRIFTSNLLDFQRIEANKYKELGLQPRLEEYNGERYVVPFKLRDKNISPVKLAKFVEQQAVVKYNLIIGAHRKLSQKGYQLGDTDFSTDSAEKYVSFVRQIEAKEKAKAQISEMQKVKQAATHAPKQKSEKFGISGEEIAEQIDGLISKAWNKVKKNYKMMGISTLIGLSALGGNSLLRGCGEKVEHTEWDNVPITVYDETKDDTIYTDFMGKKHSDHYGNIARIMELKPEISAMLISVEGFADETYTDGVGKATIGSGTTFYLDEKGNETEVSDGERITNHGAMVQKWRFIEKHLIKHLGDKLGRSCSDGELMACIGAGFCWGANAFSNSRFYESVRNGENIEQQARKLTGFRKQKGLLKREYLLSACLQGKWNAKDLLDLPIYNVFGKGYLHGAVYMLDLHEIMPCVKDEDGKYKKDDYGNDIPVVDSDDFCTFYNNYAEVQKSIMKKADKNILPMTVKPVRDFMPDEMIELINKRATEGSYLLKVQSARGGR